MSITRTKKKKVSKKLKSSWRKHVNVDDVEDFLEEKRLEERLGTLASISNDELFKVDTEPSIQPLSAKERRKLKASQPLKCFSALQPHTKVPDPIAKRNRVRTKEERKNMLVKLKEMQNAAKGILKRKDIIARKNRKLYEERKQLQRGETLSDLWSSENDKKFQIEQDEWAATTTKKHNLRGIGIPVKTVRKSVSEKRSALPAIEPPHPGISYNPSYQDHQDLLRIVADKEMKLIKEDAHLTRCTKGMFSKLTEGKRDEAWLVEMSEGLPSKQGTNTEENDATDNDEYRPINPPTRNLKKTVKQRRKQREQLALEKARRAVKIEKKKITDIHRVKLVAKQLAAIEAKQASLREHRLRNKELKKNDPKVLGAIKYEEPELEFNMGHEIAGNLKNLKSEGNLLVDRFRSMQKRNILAPTKRHPHKKAKVKKYTKPGHKDEDWKKTVAR